MRRRVAMGALALALGGAGCLEDPELDTQLFPCRAPEDCVEGYVCAPERYVCVPEGELGAVDAGAMDAGAE